MSLFPLVCFSLSLERAFTSCDSEIKRLQRAQLLSRCSVAT